MAQTNPWDAFPVAPQAPAAGGPLASPPPKPDRPDKPDKPNLPTGWRMGPNGVAERIPGLPVETTDDASVTAPEIASARGRLTDLRSLRGLIRQYEEAAAPYEGGMPTAGEAWAQVNPIDRLNTEGIRARENAAAAFTPILRRMQRTPGDPLAQQETAAYDQWLPSVNVTDDENARRLARLNEYLTIVEQDALAVLPAADRERYLASQIAPSDTAAPAASPPALGAPAGEAAPPPIGPFVNAGGQIAGNTHTGGDDNAQEIARGETRRTDNPALAGVRAEYTKRLERGDSAEQLVAWARTAGVSETAFPSIREQAAFRAERPEIAIGEYDTSQMDDMFVPLTDRERSVAESVDNPVGAATVAAGDAFTGFNMDSIIGATGGNAERARLAMGEIAERNPVASTAGTMAGGVAAALGAEAGVAGRMAPGVVRAMIGDAAYGTVAGAGATDYADDGTPATVADRFLGAGKGTLAAAGGSLLGSKVGQGLQRVGRGVADPSVAALQAEGIPMTVGQTLSRSGKTGAAIKGIEDRLSGVPVVGDMVNARRAEGVQRFNATAFNKALEPIGGTVGDVVGEEAVERAQAQVSEAFRGALSGKGAVPDQAFADELAEAVGRVRSIKRLGDEVTDQIGEILQPYADEALLSGEALDDISRGLRGLRSAYSADPLAIPVAKRLDRVEKVIFDLFDRQAEGTIPAYKAARQAYRRLSVIEDSVLKAKNTEGVFTPAQLGMADRTNTVRFGGKRAAARGDGPFHDLQRAAQNVLPNKVPDSGTAGRVLIPLALVGGGGGLDAAAGGGAGTGLTIGTILAALYSRSGQRLLTKPGRGMKPGTNRRAVLESDKTRRAIAAGSGASAVALTTQ